VFWRSRIRSLL